MSEDGRSPGAQIATKMRSRPMVSKTSTPVRTKRRTGAKTRADIMLRATQLFAQNGYDGVSMREIADALGLSVPAIYLYFKDKRNLYLECTLAVFQRGTLAIEEALTSHPEPADAIRAVVHGLVRILVEDETLARLFQWELATVDTEGLSLLEQAAFRDPVLRLRELMIEATGKEVSRLDIVAIFALAFGLIQYSKVGMAVEIPPEEDRVSYLAAFIIRKMAPDLP